MERLDEKVSEESDGVHMTLAIIENLCEYKRAEVTRKAGEQGFMTWLLKRVRVRQYDPNKLYSSEILAILLQDNEPNQRLLGETDGIDILLQSLAYYKKRDPHTTDEVELMENLFDCLCSSLMYTPNRDKFLKGEGLQLMRLMLLSKKLARCSALKVLNHAMCNVEGKDNCVKFVEIFGLGSLFPAFMKTPKPSRKTASLTREHEEHVTAIVASLFRNTSGPAKDRLVSKFLENDHEKVDRLMELHLQYSAQVSYTTLHTTCIIVFIHTKLLIVETHSWSSCASLTLMLLSGYIGDTVVVCYYYFRCRRLIEALMMMMMMMMMMMILRCC